MLLPDSLKVYPYMLTLLEAECHLLCSEGENVSALIVR